MKMPRKKSQNRKDILYYFKLITTTLSISLVTLIFITISFVYQYLTLNEAFIAASIVMLGSFIFARSYLSDLNALNNYISLIEQEKPADTPNLSLLADMHELSEILSDLKTSWNEKKIKLEAALAESKIIFDSLPDLILLFDDDLKLLRANSSAFNKLDKIELNTTLDNIINFTPLIKKAKTVIKNGKSLNQEISITSNKIIQDYNVSIEKFPIYSMGGVSIIISMHDITEQKKAKQMMKDFVANASHEIRTPLTSVIGFIETLQTLDSADDAIRKKFLQITAEQTAHIAKLVNDLLSLSTAEINETKLPTTIVNITSIIKNSISRVEWQAREKNVEIIANIDDDLPKINGDEDELMQVFVNLLSNAIKYGARNDYVEITAKKSEETNYLEISVKDNGEGIAQEDIPKITQRFFRVDKVRSRRIGGTGIGLAIVKHILNRHRANLNIQSKLGSGSKFTVELPVKVKNK